MYIPHSHHDSETFKKENLNVTFIRLDITNIETIKAAKDAIEKNDGKLDVLVNNAGNVRLPLPWDCSIKPRFCHQV